MKKTLISLSSIFIIALTFSCNHYDSITKNYRESKANEESHEEGKDCMKCHNDEWSEASSEGKWWYFAGTAYNSNGNKLSAGGKVELWSNLDTNGKGTGTLIYTVEIDKNGNFYSGNIINFRDGFYSRVVSNSGLDTTMTTKISEGSCNKCHGISTTKITLK